MSSGAFRSAVASSASFAGTSTRARPSSASTRPSSQQRLSQSQSRAHSSSSSSSSSFARRDVVRDVEGELLAAHLHSAMHLSKEEKEGYLLMLLEKEQSNESERVRLLAAIDNVGDQRRLEKIFAIERAKAAAVIKAVTREHERALALKMEQLGLIEDDEDDEHFQPQPQQQRQQQQQTDYSRRR